MRTLTPGLAIGWQLWVRNRRGACAGLATLAGLALIGPIAFPHVRPEYALLGTGASLFLVFGFFMNALLFVEAVGNVASGYPSRMYALPVPTRTLVFWPLLFGAAIVALLWVAAAGLIYGLTGFRAPVLLPALGLAAGMAWLQVLSWAPLKPAWLRLVAVALVIGGAGGVLWCLAVARIVAPEWIGAFLVGFLGAAYPSGLACVASDRRGSAWRLWPEGGRLSFGNSYAGRRPFPSPARAQFWYEWRCHGLVLPVFVAVVSLLVLGIGLLRNVERLFLLPALFVMPVLLAASVGPAIARLTPAWVKHPRVIEFLAMRPVTTRSLVSAKLQMAALSVALSWLVVLVEGALALALDDHPGEVARLWKLLSVQFPGWRVPAILTLGFLAGPALAFRQLTDYFPLALTGRPWIENLAAFVLTSSLVSFLGFGVWLQAHPRFEAMLPWLVAVLLAIKAIVAAWSFCAALRRSLLARRDLLLYGTAWLVAASLAIGLCLLTLSATLQPAKRIAVLLGVVAFVPISRFALAPLALDWNRHR